MRTAKWSSRRIEQINFLLIHNYLENPQAFLSLVCLRKLEFFYTNCVISLDIAVERWYFNNQALTRFKVLVFSTHCVSVF